MLDGYGFLTFLKYAFCASLSAETYYKYGFLPQLFMIILIKWAEACFSDIVLNTDRHYFTMKKLSGIS